MGWLTNWDDLVHGTVVFGAVVPFLFASVIAFVLPGRMWVAVAVGMLVSALWFFGVPEKFPPTSEEAVIVAVVAAALCILLELPLPRTWWVRLLVRAVLWGVLAWSLYPAWLASGGGLSKKLAVSAGMGVTVAASSVFFEWVVARRGDGSGPGGRARPTPAALVPPTVALAILLQFGGAGRFAQSAGALAAALAGVCFVLLWRPGSVGQARLVAFWGMLAASFAWSGWLFSEIQAGAAAALVLAPPVALAARALPLPRSRPIQAQLWDVVAAALVAGAVAWMGWVEYSAGAGGYEGY